MNALKVLLRLAKIREDQAMAQARRVGTQANETMKFQQQVIEYAKEYEKQILTGGQTGIKVAFIQDADAFREKLLASSSAMDKQIADLRITSKITLEEAMRAKMKSQGLAKLVAKAELVEQQKRDKAEENQFEDILAARTRIHSGTKDA
jgi:flagellar biosynthesis chaperone FliJ